MSEINIIDNNNSIQQHPLIASRGIVVLPGCNITFDVVRKMSMNAVDMAFCDESMKHEIWKALK